MSDEFKYEKTTTTPVVIHEQPTLRDLFAMAALTGLIGASAMRGIVGIGDSIKEAFDYADECPKVRVQP